MKNKIKNKEIKNISSFIKMFTIALIIYACSLIFTKFSLYSQMLKVLATLILLSREVKEVKKERTKKINIITLAILMILILKKYDEACISAIIVYIKKYIFNKKSDTEEEKTKKRYEVKKGETIILKKGNIVYFDGILKMPKAYFLDQFGKRIVKKSKEKVLSGWVNLTNNTKLEIEKPYEETEYFFLEEKKNKIKSTFSKKEEKIIKLFSFYQKLVIIASCIYLLITVVMGLEIENTLYQILLFLILIDIVNPTNLLISIINKTIIKVFNERIIVENKDILWKIRNIKNYIFEKTKTLTIGDFRITEIETEDEEKLFYYLNYGEYFSNHPIKDAILKYKSCDINPQKIKAYKIYPNRGVYYKIDNHNVLIGNLRFMKENNIDVDINFGIGTIIYVAVDNEGIGNILISDGIKYKTKLAIQNLKKTNPKHLAIISGDNERITTAIAKELKIKDHYSNLTHKEKLFWIRHLKEIYPYQTALIGSIDTKEDLLKAADVSIILTDSMETKNQKAEIQLLDRDLLKLINLHKILKEENKQETIYKIGTVLIFFIMNVLLVFNYLSLSVIIVISWLLEILEDRIRKEG